MLIITSISCTLLVIGIFIIRNLLRKLESIEDYVETLETGYEYLNNSYTDLKEKTSKVLETMRAIDSKQVFESDDEVGTAFKQLVDIVNELNTQNAE